MRCPKCHQTMEPRTVGKVVVDHCPQCAGIWFDEGELQQGLAEGGRREFKRLSGSTEAPTGHDATPADCPRCRARPPLTRVPSPTAPEVHVDACLECGGVWYDGGEVAEILADTLGDWIGRFFRGHGAG